MHDAPRQKLRELIVEYGRSLCDDPRRCEALLKDYCGQHKREIFVLVNALKNRVAEDLVRTSASVPQSILFSRLHKRLEEELAMTAEAAHWAVESWALALGVMTQPLPVVKPVPVSLPPSPPPSIPKVAHTSPRRKEASLIAGRYQDNGDGTVTDIETGLQWMRFSLGQEWKGGTCVGEAKKYTWQGALDAAKALNRRMNYASCRDWRVPTKEELQTLASDKQSPTINQTAFPKTPSWWYWSSSTCANGPDDAWLVYFLNGAVYASLKTNDYPVRLVRGGS